MQVAPRIELECAHCRLRQQPLFRTLAIDECAFVRSMKRADVRFGAGEPILAPERPVALYTLREGWAAQYRRMPGARYLAAVLLPGDVIGMQGTLTGLEGCTVETLTPVQLCALDGGMLRDLFRRCPDLAFALIQHCAAQERRIETRAALLATGTALQRVGYLFLETFENLAARDMAGVGECPFPLRRGEIAAATGLSQVHVSRTLAVLRRQHLATLSAGVLRLPDRTKLADTIGLSLAPPEPRAIL